MLMDNVIWCRRLVARRFYFHLFMGFTHINISPISLVVPQLETSPRVRNSKVSNFRDRGCTMAVYHYVKFSPHSFISPSSSSVLMTHGGNKLQGKVYTGS